MKIGILTQPLHNNYGGILQNYALQKVLKNLGHSVCTINLQYNKTPYKKTKLILSSGKRLIKKVSGDKNIIFINPQKQRFLFDKPGFYQKRFIDKNINYMTVYKKLDQDFDIQNGFEAYIVGSDQVWRPRFSTGLPNYYLDFVKNAKAKRIAYAASFGVDHWETDDDTTAIIAPLAQKFDGVSVREQSGIELCKKYLGIDAVQVLDPTMLLSAEDYRKVYLQYPSQDKEEQYIATYILDRNHRVQNVISRVSKQLNIPVKQLGTFSKEGFDSIESWIEGIDKASYVITDSFHGSVFSMIFCKQFVALGNESRGMTRFEDLFTQFDIKGCLVSTHEEAIASLLRKINYDKVHAIIAKKQVLAHQFLDIKLG